ncbi:hypothetical protein B0G77_4710 [Paraburkholderia sp. BL10I2N1]|nr:hypothetical protein B0G77_4710 [Paraburkholderia sp. BL10I2N1]
MTMGVPGCGNEGDVFLWMDVIAAKAPPVREKTCTSQPNI